MLALRLYGANDIRLVDIPVPEINDDEILLKTQAAALCGTDIRMWKNGKDGVDADHPLTLGHEFAGVIEKVGKNVPFYQKGMRVTLQPNIGCGICDRCVDGKYHLCDDYRAFGINMDGAFAEYVKIPADAVIRGNLAVIPDNISPAEAAVVEPMSCAYNGFTKCSVKPGEFALVVGAGPIGFCHASLLHMAGARVLMADISEDRLNSMKKRLPFISTTSASGEALTEYVHEWTNGAGLDIAITACPVASVQSAMPALMNYGGRVNFFGGIPDGKEPVAINTNLIHYRELYLTGSTRSSIAQFRKILDCVSRGVLNIKPILTDYYELKDIGSAFQNASEAKGIKHVIQF